MTCSPLPGASEGSAAEQRSRVQDLPRRKAGASDPGAPAKAGAGPGARPRSGRGRGCPGLSAGALGCTTPRCTGRPPSAPRPGSGRPFDPGARTRGWRRRTRPWHYRRHLRRTPWKGGPRRQDTASRWRRTCIGRIQTVVATPRGRLLRWRCDASRVRIGPEEGHSGFPDDPRWSGARSEADSGREAPGCSSERAARDPLGRAPRYGRSRQPKTRWSRAMCACAQPWRGPGAGVA